MSPWTRPTSIPLVAPHPGGETHAVCLQCDHVRVHGDDYRCAADDGVFPIIDPMTVFDGKTLADNCPDFVPLDESRLGK